MPEMRGSRLFTIALSGAMCAALLCTPPVSAAASDFSCFNIIPEFRKALETSKAVFIGEVIKIVDPSDSSDGAPLRKRLHQVIFKVEYSWKGAGFQEIGLPDFMVLAPQETNSSCFTTITFVPGRKYLVYAGETPEKELIVFQRGIDLTPGKESMLTSGTRTMLLENASDDLKSLRRVGIFRDRQRGF